MKIGIIGAGALTQPSLRWPASMAAMATAGSRRRCEGLAQRPDITDPFITTAPPSFT
jgi:hypothetical protein